MVISFFTGNKPKKKKVVKKQPSAPANKQAPSNGHSQVWAKLEVTEDRIRQLVRVRIQYLDKAETKPVDPEFPDLSGLLQTLCGSVEARAALNIIWGEEVRQFYDRAVKQAEQNSFR
ncbi:MAG: hypothetical protein OXR68_01160 [Alphaproteobacteria bacterium]|nr:hypothetical protein [Alphaproteobacteria bacterium]MDD9919219.1 hypothetical protein [Alphaproteobacteria bacterium]